VAIGVDRDEILRTYKPNLKLIVALDAVVLIAGIVVAIAVSNAIAGPITKLTKRVEQLSEGDLRSPVPEIRSRDEIYRLTIALKNTIASLNLYIGDIDGVLSNMARKNIAVTSDIEYIGDFKPLKSSMEQIIDGLNEVISQIKASAQQVFSGAEQVASGSQALASGSTEQASAVEEVFATLSSVSEETRQTAENAEEARRITQETAVFVEEGNQRMHEMITSMENIYDASNEIRKIIKTIEDIAFQTNILALNASVEAARAGTAGKGFAVVAGEVKNLATKSSEAAKNTAGLINKAISAVEGGNQIAKATADSLAGIVQKTETAGVLIENISQKAVSQSAAIEQVTEAVKQISSVVQSNSATTEESAAASEELSGQVHILNGLVSEFITK
jgi:methyl-accepting chemotaxis protein